MPLQDRERQKGRRKDGKKKGRRRKQLACVEDMDPDLVCTRGLHLDILDLEWLACTPAYGCLALDDLSRSSGHGPDISPLEQPCRWRGDYRTAQAWPHRDTSHPSPVRATRSRSICQMFVRVRPARLRDAISLIIDPIVSD